MVTGDEASSEGDEEQEVDVAGDEAPSEGDTEREYYGVGLEAKLSLGSGYAASMGEEETSGVADTGVTLPIRATVATGGMIRYFSKSDIAQLHCESNRESASVFSIARVDRKQSQKLRNRLSGRVRAGV